MQHLGAGVQPMLQWKSNTYYILWMCVCSLRYPACNIHGPYFHLWPVLFYNIFQPYCINGTIFEKFTECKMCVFILYTFSSDTFLILKRTERDRSNLCSGVHVTYPLFLSGFDKSWILSTNFWKIIRSHISWKSFQWEPSCFMRTDRRS